MGKKVTSCLGASSKETRKKIRQKLGTLKSLTVQDKTKQRYKAALAEFSKYLRQENLELPTRQDAMDGMVSDYLEYLWAQGRDVLLQAPSWLRCRIIYRS